MPGIIPPILVPVLLSSDKQKTLLALADGGIVDNQGVDSLLGRGCTHVTISDGTGQLRYESHPDVTNLIVATRATDVLMERIRELNHERLENATARGVLMNWQHPHLTSELSTAPPSLQFRIDDLHENVLSQLVDSGLVLTSYGIRRDAQQSLAEMRTDLDCFSDIELDALLLSGYLQASKLYPHNRTFAPHDWDFKAAAPDLGAAFARDSRTAIILAAGRHRFGRLPRILWKLAGQRPWVRGVVVAAGLLMASALLFAIDGQWLCTLLTGLLRNPWIHGALWVAMGLLVFTLVWPASPGKRRIVKAASAPLLLAAMPWAWCVLWLTDRWYLRLGSRQGSSSAR